MISKYINPQLQTVGDILQTPCEKFEKFQITFLPHNQLQESQFKTSQISKIF